MLERPLRPGEVSLDELERAFRETPGPAPASRPRLPSLRWPSRRRPRPRATTRSAPEAKVANQSIRVNLDTLEHLMTMVSELVLTRNQLLDIMRRHDDSEFKVPLQRLSNVTAELQEGVMKTRMQPIGNAWQKLPRIVRDLSAELGKDIELEMHGADTELDRQVLERIKDPLTHMVRNSADHGLETRADRIAAGKPEKGTIRLSAYHEGGHIIIGVADDGRGLDTERIKAKALANGLATEAELDKMSEAQIHKFIFTPGFSTAQPRSPACPAAASAWTWCATTSIRSAAASTSIRCSGEGLSFTIKIPLTLAIISALIVEAGGDRFAIPQLSVVELVRVHAKSEHRIERIKDAAVLRLRNKLLPLVQLDRPAEDGRRRRRAGARLHRGHPGRRPDLRHRGRQRVPHRGNRGEADVDHAAPHRHVLRQHHPRRRLGDHDHRSERRRAGDRRRPPPTTAGACTIPRPKPRAMSSGNTTSLLVFRAGSPAPKAVPLSLVTRLEEIDGRKIELSNDRHMVQYRGQLMPLVRVNDDVRIKGEGTQPLLVFSDGGRSMGLVVDEIVDIVEEHLDIQVGSDRQGILGSAVIRGQATEILDVGHFLPLAYEDWFRARTCRSRRSARTLLLVDDSRVLPQHADAPCSRPPATR